MRERLLLGLLGALVLIGLVPAAASSAPLEDEGGAEWTLAPILAPEAAGGSRPSTPIGLGAVGDLEFWAANRGLLITAGSGSTIAPGLWAFNGRSWHQLSTVCGATEGRIAWAGPDEFWTVSDSRPGQAADAHGDPASLADNSLCHFDDGAVTASYAAPAFQASSYQAMHGAACLSAGDCWFGGEPLPEPGIGSFHLHFNGGTGAIEDVPYEGEGRAVEAMSTFDGTIFESVRITAADPVVEHLAEPPALHLINRLGIAPTFEALGGLPLYGPNEFPEALDALALSAGSEALWAAAGPRDTTPEGSDPAPVTVLRYTPSLGWSQLIGPEVGVSEQLAGRVVRSIAAEPGTQAAWLALADAGEEHNDPTASATVARVDAEGGLSDVETLPSVREREEGVGPKGAAARIACPAPHECWVVTTQGWLFHLASNPAAVAPGGEDHDPAFAGLITYRPPDIGLPEVVPDAPPIDDSGLPGEAPSPATEPATVSGLATSTVALVSRVKVSLKGLTLQLRFRLAVKARVALIARRGRKIVAATPLRTFSAGEHVLRLRLKRARWPTKLDLRTHALAALPVKSTAPGRRYEEPFTASLGAAPSTASLGFGGPFS